ncbi:ornithine decarboxylase [Trichuris trichiura]|uniref:ornithine decarboxylase n=1 Tax=Trichuris trichiura TaxID=36087 RepID=A0A077Z655_TRITR|nr:ornithine decarboxylase [Trichuris trichiura]
MQDGDGALCVANVGHVLTQHSLWLQHLPRVQPFYAVKCNNDPMMIRILDILGCNFDCASKGEIESVMKLGVTADRIIYANPCKTASHIQHAASRGVRLMTFDNEQELCKVKKLYPSGHLLLRIAVSDPTALCPLNLKFGCDPVEEAPLLLKLAALMELRVFGISFHVGSGCRNASAYAEGIAHARRLRDYGLFLGHPMNILDLGGGYPGHQDPNYVSFEEIASVINSNLEEHFPADAGVRIIAEPGRFYAERAFTLYCTVIARTSVPASRITKNGFAISHLFFGRDGARFHIDNIILSLQEKQGKSYWSSVWGPTCDSLDLVVPCAKMSELEEGDLLVFENMGAYTLAASSEFNGFKRLVRFTMRPLWSSIIIL